MGSPFHGKTYRYGTPEHGERIIGVCQILGAFWITGWIGPDSRRYRIHSKGLPQTLKPETAQAYLDQWAALLKLPEALP